MKVDLHLHTPSSELNGDSIKWFGTMETLKTLYSKKVKALSFTDHNVFNSVLFLEARKKAANNLFVFPGVEIDIKKASGVNAHLLVIFDSKLSEQEVKKLETICNANLRKQGIKINKVKEIFNDFDYISIPHVGKGDHFKTDELDFPHEAIEVTNINHVNYNKWLKERNDKSIVAFSDTHIWRDYPQNNRMYTEIDFDGSFNGLKNALLENKNYTKGEV